MTLLSEIEAFLKRHDMTATAFGDQALGDRHLVFQLRKRRRLWPETEAKIRAFMDGYSAKPKAAAA